MDDDKGNDGGDPVPTHLRMAPSEERVLPERRQLSEGYAPAGALSNDSYGRSMSYGHSISNSQTASRRKFPV